MGLERSISYKIDKSLERIWTLIGYTDKEREEETNRLAEALIATYSNFISESDLVLQDLQERLANKTQKYEQLKEIYGDESSLVIPTMSISIRGQISFVSKAIKEIKAKYSQRVQEFQDVFQNIQDSFVHLGINESDPVFQTLKTHDYREDTLVFYKEKLESLQSEENQRVNLLISLTERLEKLTDEINVIIPAEIQEIIENEMIDTDSLHYLNDCVESLQRIRDEQELIVQEIEEKLKYLYSLLAVSPEDRIQFDTIDYSKESIQSLKDELEYMEKQKKERIHEVVALLKKEIKNVCDELRIPEFRRPRATGGNLDKKVEDLTEILHELQEQKMKDKQIIDAILEYEHTKDMINYSPDLVSRDRGTLKRFRDAEESRQKAYNSLPKIEGKLYKLLVEYKEEHGKDFVFGEVCYIEKVMPQRSASSKYGKQLLQQKINQSYESSPFSKSSRKTPFSHNRSISGTSRTMAYDDL